MPVSMKWLSINYVICNVLYFLCVITISIAYLSVEAAYHEAVYDFRIMLASATYCASCGTTCMLALERYIKLTNPYNFNKYLSKWNIIISITSTWFISFMVPFSVCIGVLVTECDSTFKSCYFSRAVRINRVTFTSIFTSFAILTVLIYSRVRNIMNSQIAKNAILTQFMAISNTNNVYSRGVPQTMSTAVPKHKRDRAFHATRNMLKIIITYVSLHVPIIFHAAIFIALPEWSSHTVDLMQFIGFCCTLISSYLALYFYIWKFKECKMRFMLIFFSWSERYRLQGHQLRIEVFNIVTFAKRDGSLLNTGM